MLKAPSRSDRVEWLRCAADYVNAFGLTKGRTWVYRRHGPPAVCTAGALRMTRQVAAAVFEAGRDINRVLRSWGVTHDFVCFNDRKRTTKSDVVRLLLETALRLENRTL